MKLETVMPIIMGIFIVILVISIGYTALISETAKWSELGQKYNLSSYTGYEEDGYAYLIKDNKTWVIAHNENGYYLCDMAVCGDPFLHCYDNLFILIVPAIILVAVLSVIFHSIDDRSPEIKRLERELEIEYL